MAVDRGEPVDLTGGMPADFAALRRHLERRLEIIADHAWRDTQPEAQLAALGEVAGAIESWHEQNRGEIPARLNHFLTQASLSKALEWLESGPPEAD